MTTFNVNGSKLEINVDGNYAGFLEVAHEGFGTYRIENTELEAEYRGKGLYKKLLAAVFENYPCETLRSHERNMHSNWCYRNWTFNDDLDGNAVVWIEKGDKGLIFTAE